MGVGITVDVPVTGCDRRNVRQIGDIRSVRAPLHIRCGVLRGQHKAVRLSAQCILFPLPDPRRSGLEDDACDLGLCDHLRRSVFRQQVSVRQEVIAYLQRMVFLHPTAIHLIDLVAACLKARGSDGEFAVAAVAARKNRSRCQGGIDEVAIGAAIRRERLGCTRKCDARCGNGIIGNHRIAVVELVNRPRKLHHGERHAMGHREREWHDPAGGTPHRSFGRHQIGSRVARGIVALVCGGCPCGDQRGEKLRSGIAGDGRGERIPHGRGTLRRSPATGNRGNSSRQRRTTAHPRPGRVSKRVRSCRRLRPKPSAAHWLRPPRRHARWKGRRHRRE